MVAKKISTPDTEHIHMTTEEWSKVEDNPIQRDTIKHATTASRPGHHLEKYHPTHRHVAAARLPSGKLIKLDGHSRSHLWDENQLLPPPEDLEVTVFEVKNREQAIAYYRTYDNKAATETGRDQMFGAMRFFNIALHHGYMFQNTGIMAAIEYVIFPTKWTDIRPLSYIERVQPWVETIDCIDKSGDFPNHNLFRSPVMLAMIMTVRRDKNEAMAFWQGYHDDIGKKGAKVADGIFNARDCFTMLHNEVPRTWGRRMFTVYSPYFLYCYDKWYDNKRWKRFTGIEGRRTPKDMLTVRQWWDEHLGDLDQPQIRKDATQLKLV